jgi:O-antigen/teichoic acid export membrane protein
MTTIEPAGTQVPAGQVPTGQVPAGQVPAGQATPPRPGLRERLAAVGAGPIVKVVAGNGSYVALGFLAQIVSANGLTPAEFGLVSLALATLNILQEVCGNGFDLAMVRLAAPHAHDDPATAARYYRAALQLKTAVNVLVAAALWAAAPWLASAVFDNEAMTTLLRWIGAGLVGASLFNYLLAKFQAGERFLLYAALRAGSNVAKLGGLAALWLLGLFDAEGVLAAWMGAFFVGFGFALLFDRGPGPAQTPWQVDRGALHEIVVFSRWVIASSFLFSLYSRIDLLLLGRFGAPEQVGNYAAAWNITFVIDLLTYSVIVALLPRAARMAHRSEYLPYVLRTFGTCAAIALLLLPLFLLSDWLFATFFPSYEQAAEIFRILFWGAVVTLLLHPLYLILYANNRVSRLTLVNLLLVLFTGATGLMVIPEYGAVGAAWVTFAGRAFASALIAAFVAVELWSEPDAAVAQE